MTDLPLKENVRVSTTAAANASGSGRMGTVDQGALAWLEARIAASKKKQQQEQQQQQQPIETATTTSTTTSRNHPTPTTTKGDAVITVQRQLEGMEAKVRNGGGGRRAAANTTSSSTSPRTVVEEVDPAQQQGENLQEEEPQQVKIVPSGDVMVVMEDDHHAAIMHDKKVDFGEDPSSKGAEVFPEQAMPFSSPVVTGSSVMMAGNGHHLMSHVGSVVLDDLEVGTLQVALPVDDNDNGDKYITTTAVEYDPDAKPPMYRNRRFRLYACLGFLVLMLAVVGAVVVTFVAKDSDENVEPVHPRLKLGIREQVESVIGAELLNGTDSPYSRALDWITFEDEMQMLPEDKGFMQRYVAAYFYYATTVDGPWDTCNPPPADNRNDTACALKQLVQVDPLEHRELAWNRWLTKLHVCFWAGVYCDEAAEVRALEFAGNGLSGTFPEGIKHFRYLQSLSILWEKGLRGTLPADLMDLKHLISLELNANSFTGTIPMELWKARYLQRLSLGDNLFTGTIPSEIQELRGIKGLYLFGNQLHGPLPTELGALSAASFIRMQRNQFTGTIPTEIGQMGPNLEVLRLQENFLTGTIPTELGLLSKLAELRLSENPLTGTVPEEIWGHTDLVRLDLDNCRLNGTISDKILDNTNLNALRLANNSFFGTIPEGLGMLANGTLSDLDIVWLDGNDFTGTMPESLCMKNATELQADCLADSFNDIAAELECALSCCTYCCQADGTNCVKTNNNEGDL